MEIEHIETNKEGKPNILYKWKILELEGKNFKEKLKQANHYIQIWVNKEREGNTEEIIINADTLIIKYCYSID